MAHQSNSLLKEIEKADNECGQILQDIGIVEDNDLKALCYESLKDIFPGSGKKIVQRSKVWNIIKKSLKTGETSSVSSPSTSVDLTDDNSDGSTLCDNDDVKVSTPKHPRGIRVEHPKYSVYVDQEISAASSSGTMSHELKCRLIRATIHNMISAAAHPPFSRYPLTMEIEEMAKSLVIAYPCLRDDATGHGDLFKKLKKKLSNSKPTKKPQGPCPNKRRKVEKTTDACETESPKITEFLPIKEQSASSKPQDIDEESNDHHSNAVDNTEVMKRHYNQLQKEMEKKKPNVNVVNSYLNKQFPARRTWLQMIPAEQRCKAILDDYPCFSDHVEIIEEVRRVLNVKSTERIQFTSECVNRLIEEIDILMFYGISKGLRPPRSPKLSSKIVHVLKMLTKLFARLKPLKKAPELLHELQDHEDPDSFCIKQTGNSPVFVVDSEMVYIIVGKIILCQTELENVAAGVVAFLGAFYLLDFDYPKQHEFGLLMLQTIVFKDKEVPADIAPTFEGTANQYRMYKSLSA